MRIYLVTSDGFRTFVPVKQQANNTNETLVGLLFELKEPDHLGSSSFITNLDGEVVQHIEYVPFGEVFIEERNNVWNTPYLFNAKEFDEEMGMYYYGARYYDPRISLWMSTDPMQEKFFGDRPDWDGKLTLSEANEWYRKGTGEKLFVDINSLDLSNFYSLGEEYVDKKYSFNLLIYGNPVDGLVFGSITFKRTPNHGVKAFNDIYDFDIKEWSGMNIIRNIETYIGEWVAGSGKPYEIVIYGEQKLKPKYPWLK